MRTPKGLSRRNLLLGSAAAIGLGEAGGRNALGAIAAAPAQNGAALCEVVLRNTDAKPSPDPTCVAFGHPFRKGDIAAGASVRVSLADGTRVPAQLDQIARWNDNSIRFCVIKVRTGAIPANGTLALKLASEAAARQDLPAGKTAADIARALGEAHPFRIGVANLTRGCKEPKQDGSGAFAWNLVDQLALEDWADRGSDGKKRARVAVIEAGPLCCCLRVWGPLRDAHDKSDHPQLIVIGYYRVWLEPGGAIDRAEHMHAIHQGWISALDGTSKSPAGLQIGDWTLTLNGAPIEGTSLGKAVRISHHSRHFCADAKGKALWTRNGGNRVYAKFDTLYWFRTRVPPPFDIPYFQSHPIEPAKETAPVTYHAGNSFTELHLSSGKPVNQYYGKQSCVFNQGGQHEYLELVPSWSHRAYIAQDPGYMDSEDVTALFWGHQPSKILNEETGRIPSAVTETFPKLGSGHGDLLFYSSEGHSEDFPPLEAWNPARKNAAVGYGDGEDTEGGWNPIGWDSHTPSNCFMPYLRTGAPWLLDLMVLDASNTILNKTSGVGPEFRDRNEFGRLWRGLWFLGRQYGWGERAEAWSWKMVYQCLAVLPANAPEFPEHAYLKYAYDQNCDHRVATIEHASEAQKATGVWIFSKFMYVEPWMELYLFLSRSHEYLLLEDPRTLTFLDFHKTFVRGLGGDAVKGSSCGWMMGSYETLFGVPLSQPPKYFASWDEVPDYCDARKAEFDAVGGYVGFSQKSAGYLLDFPYENDDRVMFSKLGSQGALDKTTPPPGIDTEIMYWVVDADVAAARFKISRTQGGPPLKFSDAKGISIYHKKSLSKCPVAGSCDFNGGDSVADGKIGLYYATVAIGQAAGVRGLDKVWQAAQARAAAAGLRWSSGNSETQYGDMMQSAKHKMAPHIP